MLGRASINPTYWQGIFASFWNSSESPFLFWFDTDWWFAYQFGLYIIYSSDSYPCAHPTFLPLCGAYLFCSKINSKTIKRGQSRDRSPSCPSCDCSWLIARGAEITEARQRDSADKWHMGVRDKKSTERLWIGWDDRVPTAPWS